MFLVERKACSFLVVIEKWNRLQLQTSRNRKCNRWHSSDPCTELRTSIEYSISRNTEADEWKNILMKRTKMYRKLAGGFAKRMLSSFQNDFETRQIAISRFQRVLLSVGSATVSIYDPKRADLIACLSEVTGLKAAVRIRERMLESEEGSEVLRDKPRIHSRTLDLNALSKYPAGTLGKCYSDFLISNNVTPDSRNFVQFIEDPEIAYVIQRYRECHDIFHTLLQMPTNMLGEVTVKWVEALQFGIPMCIGAALFGPVRLKQKHRNLYFHYHLPWAIKTATDGAFLMNLYFEKRWSQPISDIYREMNIQPLVIDKLSISK